MQVPWSGAMAKLRHRRLMAKSRAGGWVKVVLRGPDGEIETPWAERVGPTLFRLDNLPWVAYGVSDDDVIEAAPTADEGVYEFVRVERPSGNRLVRIIFADEHNREGVLMRLRNMGCHYEGATRAYVSVSIP